MAAHVNGASWQGRRAVVTGGTGFISGALARRLAGLGAEVIVPTRDRSLIGGAGEHGIRHVASASGNATRLAEMVAGADAVFNFAYDFRRSAEENVALYSRIADACAAGHVPMLVQASSIAVYDGWPVEDVNESSPCDGPGHEYKIAKRTIENDVDRRVAAGDFDAVILQPTIVYGAGSPQWVDALVERMAGGMLILPEGLNGLCNGVHIDDVVEAFVAAGLLERGSAERFIVSGPNPFPWRDLFTAWAEACGARVRFEGTADFVPPRPAISAVRPSPISMLARRASALAADTIGAARLERLRSRLMGMKPGGRVYRPALDNPRLFYAQGRASIEKMRARLHEPTVGADEGIARTQTYIRAKYPPSRGT